MQTLKGIAVSSGVAIAKIHHLAETTQMSLKKFSTDKNVELNRFNETIKEAVSQLELLTLQSKTKIGQEHAEIFSAQTLMLKDPMLIERVTDKIMNHQLDAAYAFRQTMSEFIDMFEISDNLYIKERILDLKDVTKRVLDIFSQKEMIQQPKYDMILVAKDLLPSETLHLDTRYIKGILTQFGSKTSHSAILSRHLGIPSISNIDVTGLEENAVVIMDGKKGLVIIHPTEEVLTYYEDLKEKIRLEKEKFSVVKDLKIVTKDHKHIPILANIGTLDDIDESIHFGADGIGLLRTENQYMEQNDFPTEDELFEFYQKISERYQDKKIVVRTLDIGGDKNLSYLNIRKEANPFLGNRAIRYSLSYPALFKTQLRAILKANKHQNLSIMFPMISTIDELRQAKSILHDAISSLKEEFIEVIMPPLGIMVEVPSTAIGIEKFLKEIDFISIGTNDLIQYLFAADRMNDKVSYLYQPYNPILLKLIKDIVDKAHEFGIMVSVCGEMAANLKQAFLLIGLGIDALSMHSNVIPEIKYQFQQTYLSDLKSLANQALQLETNIEVHDLVDEYLKKLLI